MNLPSNIRAIIFLLAFGVVFTLTTQAQTDSPSTELPQRQTDSHKDPQADDVEVLKLRVNQLEKLVEQQQRLMSAMEKRLGEVEEKNAALTKPATAPAVETKSVDATIATAPKSGTPSTNEKATAPAQENKPLAGWNKDHAFLQSADGSFTTNIIGFAQFDFRGYQAGDHPPDTFLVRRARLGVEGKLANYFDYRVQGDFADTRNTLLRDAFLTIHKTDEFQLRFGQFKEPFSQEEMSSITNIDFVERSMADNLAPSRSPGVMAFGLINKGVFEYAIGAFNGKGLLANNNNNTPEGIVRFRFSPLKNKLGSMFKNFAFGGAYAQGRNQDGVSVTGQTESRSFMFFAPEPVNGKITRANGEFSWTLRQAQIRAEYDQVNQAREGLGLGGSDLPGVVAKAFVGQFTYLLTGENKSETNPVTPKHELFSNDGSARGFGAWELKARFARLQVADATAKSNHAASFYFGANWYMNRFLKYVIDFGIERFNDPVRSPNPKDRNYFVHLNRLQFTF
ncbi:MAG: porin [Acidobacteriota bacterium]